MNEMEQIKEVLVEMQHETLAGVFMGCACCHKGVMQKIADVVPYWDKLMTIVQSSTQKVNKEVG